MLHASYSWLYTPAAHVYTGRCSHQLCVEDDGGTDARRQPGADNQDERDRGIVVVFFRGAHLFNVLVSVLSPENTRHNEE